MARLVMRGLVESGCERQIYLKGMEPDLEKEGTTR